MWRRVCVNDFVCFGLRGALDGLVRRRQELKMITAAVTSLFASLDTVPAGCAPVFEFEKLDPSDEAIVASDRMCQEVRQRVLDYQIKNMGIYKEMSQVGSLFLLPDRSDMGGDIHAGIFASFIDRFRGDFDDVSQCMRGTCSATAFLDFLMHPNCFAAASVQGFLLSRNGPGFGRLKAPVNFWKGCRCCDPEVPVCPGVLQSLYLFV